MNSEKLGCAKQSCKKLGRKKQKLGRTNLKQQKRGTATHCRTTEAQDCAALLAVAKAFKYEGWDSLAVKSKSVCDWPGIKCELGRVTSMDLSHKQIRGSISPAVGNFMCLASLIVANDKSARS